MDRLVRVSSWVLNLILILFLSGCNALRWNEPPTAAFEPSAEEVYPGEEILFDASASVDPDGKIEAFRWDFGDGNRGSGEVVIHAYFEPGAYTVTLTVTDDRGATDTAEATITVLPLPEGESLQEPGIPVARFSFHPENPTVGQEVVFDASASYDSDGEIVLYVWDFGDGEVTESVVVHHVYVDSGVYEVILFVKDDAGNGNELAKAIKVHSLTSLANQKPMFCPDQGEKGLVERFARQSRDE
ncbi:MAG: PKD domain-containing protein [Candidatus Methanomethyliaceae archaeon]